MTVVEESRQEMAEGLRALATFLEESRVPLPTKIEATHFCEPDDLANLARELPRPVAKHHFRNSGALELVKDFGGAVTWNAYASDVCERRQVGTKKVERQVPLTEETRTETVEEPVFEWDCGPLLKAVPDAGSTDG